LLLLCVFRGSLVPLFELFLLQNNGELSHTPLLFLFAHLSHTLLRFVWISCGAFFFPPWFPTPFRKKGVPVLLVLWPALFVNGQTVLSRPTFSDPFGQAPHPLTSPFWARVFPPFDLIFPIFVAPLCFQTALFSSDIFSFCFFPLSLCFFVLYV